MIYVNLSSLKFLPVESRQVLFTCVCLHQISKFELSPFQKGFGGIFTLMGNELKEWTKGSLNYCVVHCSLVDFFAGGKYSLPLSISLNFKSDCFLLVPSILNLVFLSHRNSTWVSALNFFSFLGIGRKFLTIWVSYNGQQSRAITEKQSRSCTLMKTLKYGRQFVLRINLQKHSVES